jgi:hypothetical protein
MRRIKKEMEAAARKGAIYHLWWHPHNFGRDMENNFEILGKLIAHYNSLREKYGMETLTMGEVAERFRYANNNNPGLKN